MNNSAILETPIINPDLAQLLTKFLLLKVGGQIQFALTDLVDNNATYDRFRIAYNKDRDTLTLTLLVDPNVCAPLPTTKKEDR